MAEMNRIKINIGDILVELEGDGIFVKELFSDIRENGFGKLSITTSIKPKNAKVNEIEETSKYYKKENDETPDISDDFKLPTLNDIVMKEIIGKESDWLIVYAMYQSEQGEKTFKMEEIRNKYHETNRYTKNRNKNFATNLKKLISEGIISGINETDYKLTDKGIDTARKILFSNGENKKKRKRTNGKHYTKQSFKIIELGLSEDQRTDFKTIFNNFKKISNMEKVLIISHWLKKNLNNDEVDANTIFTMLRIADASASFDIKATLRNAKHINAYYVAGSKKGNYKLHHIGEDHYKELALKE